MTFKRPPKSPPKPFLRSLLGGIEQLDHPLLQCKDVSGALAERAQAQQRAKAIREQAEALLTQATLDAGRMMTEAEKRAEQIGGDAYIALRDKQTLEQAVQPLWNVTEGYGDRYVVPSHSILDDLAIEFGYNAAGQALAAARDQSRRMVEQKQASSCNYEEEDRRDRANRFVVDAFNRRVDAILSCAKHDTCASSAIDKSSPKITPWASSKQFRTIYQRDRLKSGRQSNMAGLSSRLREKRTLLKSSPSILDRWLRSRMIFPKQSESTRRRLQHCSSSTPR